MCQLHVMLISLIRCCHHWDQSPNMTPMYIMRTDAEYRYPCASGCCCIDKGRIGSYTKLCDFTLLFMILQVEL
jgi:hypothetical protein